MSRRSYDYDTGAYYGTATDEQAAASDESYLRNGTGAIRVYEDGRVAEERDTRVATRKIYVEEADQ